MAFVSPVNRGAAAIVTFNRRDFGLIPLRFRVDVLAPIEAVSRIRG